MKMGYVSPTESLENSTELESRVSLNNIINCYPRIWRARDESIRRDFGVQNEEWNSVSVNVVATVEIGGPRRP